MQPYVATRVDMCVDAYEDMCLGMFADVCVDMCVDTCAGMGVAKIKHVCMNVCVCARARPQLRAYMCPKLCE